MGCCSMWMHHPSIMHYPRVMILVFFPKYLFLAHSVGNRLQDCKDTLNGNHPEFLFILSGSNLPTLFCRWKNVVERSNGLKLGDAESYDRYIHQCNEEMGMWHFIEVKQLARFLVKWPTYTYTSSNLIIMTRYWCELMSTIWSTVDPIKWCEYVRVSFR